MPDQLDADWAVQICGVDFPVGRFAGSLQHNGVRTLDGLDCLKVVAGCFFFHDHSPRKLARRAQFPTAGTIKFDLVSSNLAHREITPIKRTIRRDQLREMVPLADSTIYEMEQRGEFPRRFALSPRCVVWDLAEVEAWLAARRATPLARAPHPDVRQRRTRPVKVPGRAAGAALKGE